ncbi:MAG: hypothetical protein HOK72_00425, partial [Flavobacteriales bacterium]|nr:hypothetical protein [Flavobacteriales bacterium]
MTREQIELEQELNRILERRAALQGGLNAASSAQVNLSSQSAAAIENQSAARGRDRTSQQASLDQMEAMGNATEENTKKKGWATKASELYNKSLATMQNLYKSVIAPLKTFYSTFVTFSWLYDSAAEAAAGYSAQAREMFEAQQATIDAFGALTGDTQKRFKEFMSSATSGANSFSKSGRGLRSVWGLGVSAVLTNMTAIYKEFGNEAALLSEKINDNASAMILYKESLHISYEAQKLMMKGAHDSKEEFANLSKTIVSGSKIAGVSIKNVGTNIDAAAKDFKNFGWMTKKELADTSIYATKLGFDIAELTGFADKFDTFEGAAESIGKLSAAFGIQLDTMDMVMEDNPAKKLDMVREALERSGRSIKDIAGNRREMQYLADTIGLPIDKIKEMSEVSMDEFGFAKLSEETAAANKKMNEQDALNDIAKNMKTISDGMKDLDPTGFFGNFTKGFKDFMEHSGMYHHAMGRISKSLRAFYDIGKEVASAVSSLFYQPKKDGTNGAPMADLFEAYLDYFDRMGAAAKQVGEKIKPIFEFLGQIYSGKLLDDAKKGKIDNIIDWLMDPFID